MGNSSEAMGRAKALEAPRPAGYTFVLARPRERRIPGLFGTVLERGEPLARVGDGRRRSEDGDVDDWP
ncbi:MAG: hypothetical protein ACYTKD_11015 [Planctomycetota bacterium]|jgi:hypothetical protein